jgi:hypothetical protein
VEPHLQEAINALALDLAHDGAGAESRQQALREAERELRPFWIEALLERRLAAIGSSAQPPNIERILDSDADGVVNVDDNCPLLGNPDQAQPAPGSLCNYTLSFDPLLGPSDAEGSPASALTADFSADGVNDVLYVMPGEGMWLSEGQAGQGLAARRVLSVPANPGFSHAAVRLDTDARADLVAYSAAAWVGYLQDEAGGFSQGFNLWPTGLPEYLGNCLLTPNEPWRVWGDLDADGRDDVLFHAGDYCLVAMFTEASGQLGRPVLVADMTYVSGLPNYRSVGLGVPALADVNGDGHVDVVVGQNDVFALPPLIRSSVSIFLGDGSGGFAQAGQVPLADELLTTAPTLLDIDQDGALDVLVHVLGLDGGHRVQPLLGSGTGGLVAAAVVKEAAPGGADALAVGDLDGDGRLDAATSQLGVLFGGAGTMVDGGPLVFDTPGISYTLRGAIARGQGQCLIGDYLWRKSPGRKEAGLVTLCL